MSPLVPGSVRGQLPSMAPDADDPLAGASALGPPASEGINWQRYLAALNRRKWLIVAITTAGAAAGVFGSRLMDPEYLAETTLWFEVSRPGSADEGPIGPRRLLESFAWIELLKTHTVLDPVVRDLRLYLYPGSSTDGQALTTFSAADSVIPGEYSLAVSAEGDRFVLSDGEGRRIQAGSMGEPVGPSVGFHWIPPAGSLPANSRIRFSIDKPRDVARGLGQALQTRMAEDGYFLRVSLSGTSPEKTARVLNAVAKRYVTVAAELKRAKLDELTSVLREQLQSAERNLRDAEIALENFRVYTITLPSDRSTPVAPGLELTRDPVFASFFEMKIEREQLRRDREAIARILAQPLRLSLDGLALVPALETAPELQRALEERTEKGSELRALRQRYTDEHPPVRRLIEELTLLEEQAIPRMARALEAQLADREAELESRVVAASTELEQIPPRVIEEARLQRQVGIADNLHGMLRQRYEEARLAAASSSPDVRILDAAAVPQSPVSDPRSRFVILAIMGSLGMSVLGVILLDRMDPKLRFPEEVTGGLGLHILGGVPHLKTTGSLGQEAESASQIWEAFREIRTGVLHGAAEEPLTLTISSPGSGDGKSFVSSNLALAFARQGYQTLLIDGDIRRGALHKLFRVERTPGLTDYLLGDATAADTVQPTRFPSLHLIGSGSRVRIGPELLGSQAMAQLISYACTQYEVVLIDSAPLGAGVDSCVLGTLTRNLVLVLRMGATDRELAQAKLDLVYRLPLRILGAVLNDIPATKAFRYYSYLAGYRVEQEEGASAPVALNA